MKTGTWQALLKSVVATMTVIVMVLMASGSFAGERDNMLLEAAAAGRIDEVRTLLAEAVKIDVRDRAARTPLLLATRANHVEVAKALIEAGADVNAKDVIKDTPFLYAGAEGRNEILKAILASGKANLKDTNRYGGVALIPASHHGYPDTVRILLETDIDIDHVNNLGWTALLEAVILGDGGEIYEEIVELLVFAGAKNISDRDGKTPLDHARERGFSEMAVKIATGVATRGGAELATKEELQRIEQVLAATAAKDWTTFKSLSDEPFSNEESMLGQFGSLKGLSDFDLGDWQRSLHVSVHNDGSRSLEVRLPPKEGGTSPAVLYLHGQGTVLNVRTFFPGNQW
ncbi:MULTISPECIES: ankyrin repeat domain-containing protein [unclassified Mesorhizobium]